MIQTYLQNKDITRGDAQGHLQKVMSSKLWALPVVPMSTLKWAKHRWAHFWQDLLFYRFGESSHPVMVLATVPLWNRSAHTRANFQSSWGNHVWREYDLQSLTPSYWKSPSSTTLFLDGVQILMAMFNDLRKTGCGGRYVLCIPATILSCLPGLLSTQNCKLLLVSFKIVKAEMPACQ